LPPVSLGASPEIPPGVYNVTLTFSTDPPYSPAVESGAKGPVKTLVIKVKKNTDSSICNSNTFDTCIQL
jgi:hypothetical protein